MFLFLFNRKLYICKYSIQTLMDKKRLALVIVMTFLLVLPFVSAATSPAFDTLGETLSNVFDLIAVEVKIPHPGYSADERVTILELFAVFTITFILFWVGAGYTKIFKDSANKGARTWFAVAITLLIIFAAPYVEWISAFLGGLGNLLMGYIVIGLFIMMLITVFKRGKAGLGQVSAESARDTAENLKVIGDAKNKIDDILDQQNKRSIERRARRNLRRYVNKL